MVGDHDRDHRARRPLDPARMTVYRNEVTTAHVGLRVTVRHMVPEGPAGHRVPTDVVGHLVAADDTSWTIRRRSGEEVAIPVEHVVASKLLPPAPPRRGGRRPERPHGTSSHA